jgi:hypothetical protein
VDDDQDEDLDDDIEVVLQDEDLDDDIEVVLQDEVLVQVLLEVDIKEEVNKKFI